MTTNNYQVPANRLTLAQQHIVELVALANTDRQALTIAAALVNQLVTLGLADTELANRLLTRNS